jgi:hypothetical protein
MKISKKISYTYVAGEVQNLDLDFIGTKTCDSGDLTETPKKPSKSSRSSNGRSGSKTNTQEVELTKNETIVDEKILDNNSQSGGSSLRKSVFNQNTESETSVEDEDIEVITSEKSNTTESDLEVKKEIITGFSGSIVKNIPKPISRILVLFLSMTGFFIWRQNKISKIKVIAATKASTTKKNKFK